jgi:hypothetical protein
MLHDFLTANRDEIIARTRAKAVARSAPPPAEEELQSGVPLFLSQLTETFGSARSASEASEAIGRSAAVHGREQLRLGFTVAQVVHDYGDVCQSVTELAGERDTLIPTAELSTLNRCLDDAMAQAITEYTALRDRTITDLGTQRVGVLASEMRCRLSTAMMSFDLLESGSVGAGGGAGATLGLSLSALGFLIDRCLADVGI